MEWKKIFEGALAIVLAVIILSVLSGLLLRFFGEKVKPKQEKKPCACKDHEAQTQQRAVSESGESSSPARLIF